MKKSNQKLGFTLIELLVVISIMSLLASLVLVPLKGARNRAKDARIIAEMGQIRTSAETYYSFHNTYADSPTMAAVCAAAGCTSYSVGTPEREICDLCKDIDAQNGANGGTPTFQATANEYCAYAVLASSAGRWFCIDEARAIETTTNPGTTCTTSAFDCP